MNYLLLLVLSVSSSAYVKKQIDDCPRDALYTAVLHQGVDFCSYILKSNCTQEILPTDLAHYPREQILSQCKCILDPCHHGSTATMSPGNQTSLASTTTSTPYPGTNLPMTTSTIGTVNSSNISSVTSQSMTIISVPAPSNATTSTTTTTPWPISLPGMKQSPITAMNFTSVTLAAASSLPSCYHVPAADDGLIHGASLYNTEILKSNDTLPSPYIESVYFDSERIHPIFLVIRDSSHSFHHIDVSDPHRVAIADSFHNVMRIDQQGIHFTTVDCRYDLSILVQDMYGQLRSRYGGMCAGGNKLSMAKKNRFTQVLYLKDQCGDPIDSSIQPAPMLKVGEKTCSVAEIDSVLGKWTFDCMIPRAGDSLSQCEQSVKTMLDDVLINPFNNVCMDMSSVVTALGVSTLDLLGEQTLRQGLYQFATTDTDRHDVEQAVMAYRQLWAMLQLALFRGFGSTKSALKLDVDTYRKHRNIENDVCEAFHTTQTSFNMNFVAGTKEYPSLDVLNNNTTTPRAAFDIAVQNSAKIACCSPGRIATLNETSGICSYPDDALIGNNGCICGQTSSQKSVAFKSRECDNFLGECQTDQDCGHSEDRKLLCLIGNCCNTGVCFDPFECAQN